MSALVGIEFDAVDTVDDAVVAHVVGEIDMSTAPDFIDQLAAAHKDGILGRRVVVDLSGVTFFSSSGLRALIVLKDTCWRDVQLRIVPTPMVSHVLSISGADQVLELAKTVTEALADLGGGRLG